jgi:uncharacterized membrane protein
MATANLSATRVRAAPRANQAAGAQSQGERMSDQIPSAANPSGLSENAAGALAYIFIPAIVFLLVEPYNRNTYVRFQSWQSIFFFVAWIVLDILIGVFMRVVPFFGLLALALYPLASLAMLIVWIMLLIKALNGQKLKLPIIGDLAEKQANS